MDSASRADAALEAQLANAASNNERALLLCEAGWEFYHTRPAQMLALCMRAREYALQGGEQKTYAYTLGYIGTALLALQRFHEALPFISEALDLYTALGCEVEQGDMYSRLGIVHYHLNQIEVALRYFLDSLAICERINHPVKLGAALMNVAKVHSALENRATARFHILRALEVYEKVGESGHIASVHVNLGAQYGQNNEYAQAAHHFHVALQLLEQTGDEPDLIAQCLYNLGALSTNTGEHQQSLDHYTRAQALYEKLENPSGVTDTRIGIGQCYHALGNHARARDVLLDLLDESAVQGEKIKGILQQMQVHSALVEVYEALSEPGEALAHQRQYIRLLQRKFDADRQKTTIEMQMRYDVERERREKEELRTRMLEAEQSAVRSQINPHFISNALASIQAFLTEGDRTSAYRYLSRFGRLIRATLENTRLAWIPLRQELETLELYLELEQLRFGNAFRFTIAVHPAVDPVMTRVPPMLLQPFAENAIRHGLLPMRRRGTLRLTIAPGEDDSLHCSVEDNGIGREESERRKATGGALAPRTSLGLKLLEERCALLRASTGKEFRIVVHDLLNRYNKPAGTRVEITMPWMRSSSDTSS